MASKTQTNSFTGSMNLDLANEVMPTNSYKEARNFDCNNAKQSTIGLGGNILGNTKLEYTNPSGNSTVIGSAKYEKENSAIEFVYNDEGNHQIRLVSENSVTLLLEADWLNFQNKELNNPTCYDDYVVWNDGVNEPRMFNIQWMLNYQIQTEWSKGILYFIEDSLPYSPYDLVYYISEGNVYAATNPASLKARLVTEYTKDTYYSIEADDILLLALPPTDRISYLYDSDLDYNGNKLFGNLYKFAYKYEYLDGRHSVYSHISDIVYPVREETSKGYQLDEKNNNCINLFFNSGGHNVKAIYIAMIESDNESSVSIIKKINKFTNTGGIGYIDGRAILRNSITEADRFYNNEAYLPIELTDIYELNEYIPELANTQDILSNGRILLGDMRFPSLDGVITDMTAEVLLNTVSQEKKASSTITVTTFSTTGFGTSPTFSDPVTYSGKKISFNFPDGYTSGLILEFDFLIYLTGTIYFNQHITIDLPYDRTLTETENKEFAMLYAAQAIRYTVHFYSRQAWSNPDDILASGLASKSTVFQFNETNFPTLVGTKYPPYVWISTYRHPSVVAMRGDLLNSAIQTAIGGSMTNNELIILESETYGGNRDGLFVNVGNNGVFYQSLNTTTETYIELSNISLSDIDEQKFESLKSNDILNIGIKYEDSKRRTIGIAGFTQLRTIGFGDGESSLANYFKSTQQIPKITINHIPPKEAYYYSIVISQSVNLSKSVMLPISTIVSSPPFHQNIGFNITIQGEINANSNYVISPWVYESGDKLRHVATRVADDNYTFATGAVHNILGQDVTTGDLIIDSAAIIAVGDIVEVFRQSSNIVDTENDIYFEIGDTYSILNPTKLTRAHYGNIQSQVVSNELRTTSAILTVPYGNIYINKTEISNPDNSATYTVTLEQENYSNYYASNFYDKGKPVAFIDNVTTRFKNMLRFGGKLLPESSNNYIANFDYDDYKELSMQYGAITGIRSVGDTVIVAQERKITSFYVDKTSWKNADGTEQVVLSDGILDNKSVSEEDYGCINPESIIKKGTHVLFFDANNGIFVRHAKNGMYPISAYGISEFSKMLGNNSINNGISIIGQYDERLDRMFWTIPTMKETISFDDSENAWKSFYDFYTESGEPAIMLGSLNNYMLGFVNGDCYVFNNERYNELFGATVETSVTTVVNTEPVLRKSLNYLSINSNRQWIPNKDGDVSTDYGKQLSKIRLMKPIEGKYVSEFKRNILFPNGSYRLDENSGEILNCNTATVTLRTSSNLKTTISNVTFGVTYSEKII